MIDIVPVVLCGGSGTRLWPKSRKSKPKPFLPLVGDTTLFTATLLRCARDVGFGDPLVVTGAEHLAYVEQQVPEPDYTRIIVEPEGRNTAAAIALAALSLPQDAIMLVCPSDHHIGDVQAFQSAAMQAAELAGQGWLVSIGITPTAPETGFGYLKQGEGIGQTTGRRVERFVEKPDLARAMEFLASGEYAWNGGIFAFRVGTFIEELGRYRPEILAVVRQSMDKGVTDGPRIHPDAETFAQVRSESVDYAVMENTDRAAMVPAVMAWSDIGNWQALHEALERDDAGNTVRGTADLRDCSNVLVMSDGPRVSAVGVSDLIVVVDGNEVLICTPEGAQGVGKLSGAISQ
ncbi:mannose-1-phosphate guanylyltransferase [Novosphingobium sp. SL115]|uniref:mannose-1-phosphate guanylyltransferase n=1 Tax=Novosphingobium sp. SL115 TaxID=2995150 RepID=UPI002276E6C7|nr:mannose-1-phosphate guanylyltransferase [Novosphingobium sp. SL115]MCY1670960.1 mannose-1-phosphate guanylyltransferase [Novosphingobium sp. SL115]